MPMRISSIMSHDLACCTPDTPLRQVAQMMIDRDCGSIPVVSDYGTRKVIGMVTDRDITVRLVAVGINPVERTARDCMTSPVHTVDMNDTIDSVQAQLEVHQLRRMPVVDSSNGICCGIITQADIARYAPSSQTGEFLKQVSRPAPTLDEIRDEHLGETSPFELELPETTEPR